MKIPVYFSTFWKRDFLGVSSFDLNKIDGGFELTAEPKCTIDLRYKQLIVINKSL